MSLKFPSPKSTFQSIKSAFGVKPAQRPKPGGTGPSARMPFTSDLPRRNASSSPRRAAPPPRQAPPRQAGGTPGSARPEAASSARPGRAQSQGEKLLGEMSLAHLDRMKHDQLAEVVTFLEGRHHEPGAAKNLAMLSLPLVHNWKLLRKEFSDLQLQHLIATRPMDVLAILKKPAPGSASAEGARPERKPAGAPASEPGARHQWNQRPPRGPAASASARPEMASPPPVSIVGLGRQAATRELKARGVGPAQLKAMSQAFSEYANFGGEERAAEFKKTYGHLAADDITNSTNRSRLALFFMGLARENQGA